jgi:hypothetical protein
MSTTKRPRRKREANEMPVMKQQCATCPFGPGGDPLICRSVTERIVRLRSSQICHHPSLSGKPETHLCRGARDLQLKILTAMGAISAPTDEAFQAKWNQLKETHE